MARVQRQVDDLNTNDRGKKRAAVFLVHPRDERDLTELFWWTRFIPGRIMEKTMPKLSGRLGHTICEKINVYDKLDVYLLAVLLKGHQMVPSNIQAVKKVRKRILEAVQFSQDYLNAEVIGLGALTASVTDGGRWLTQQEGIKASITHGDTYSALTAINGITRVIDQTRLKNPRVAVVGAYGLIGSALCRSLSKKYELIMMGRNRTRLEQLHSAIGGAVTITTDILDIGEADIVATATNSPDAIIKSEHLKTGAIVYDLAQPANVSLELLWERRDIIKIDGSLVKTPGIEINFEMRTGRGATFACLGETMLLALEGIKGHYVGDIDTVFMERLSPIGRKYGFEHADFTQFGERLDEKDLLKI